MFLKHIDLTTALRPAFLPDEVLHCLQDNVGLYEGKLKIPDHQNGKIYLTSYRICYVDNEDPRKNSVAIDLKEIERYEFYAGFRLTSSPKITLFPKPSKRGSIQNLGVSIPNTPSRSATASPLPRGDSPFHLPTPSASVQSAATWICTICSFSNPVPSNFDLSIANEYTPLAPCLACGIKPQFAHVLKAAISSASNRPQVAIDVEAPRPNSDAWIDKSANQTSLTSLAASTQGQRKNEDTRPCARCTFLNHAFMMTCEICGAPLVADNATPAFNAVASLQEVRSESPGPTSSPIPATGKDNNDIIKLSFRGGGEKDFYRHLKECMIQRKWVLRGAPPVPRPDQGQEGGSGTSTPTPERMKTVGIAGLEQRRLEERKNNELVIGNAFEDLEALMASAKQIISLAESFAHSNGSGADSSAVADALGMITTKDMFGSGAKSESLYISELSRNLAEYLTDDARGVLRKSGGIISLVDLWAMFNRARGGVELVSPLDFEKAARLWESLKLPLRLREFKSGVLVVQGSDRTDAKTIKSLLTWLASLHSLRPEKEVAWDWQEFGRGVTAQDVAEHFNWSLGVAEEELDMAEQKGALCKEESIEGTKFWENWIDSNQAPTRIGKET